MTSSKDRKLGMHRDITRRDFLNGLSIAAGGSLLAAPLVQALASLNDSTKGLSAQMMRAYYPPTRDGMRGSHPGAFEVAHQLRDGKRWDHPSDSIDSGEHYDLVVVGGGISGLAAAYFYQEKMGPDVRILIVENHDDFGGHAKRNEFNYKGRTLVELGGTEYIEAPWRFPESAKTLLKDLNIDVDQAKTVFDHDLYPSLGLSGGVFFDKQTFGSNRLVAGSSNLKLSDHQPSYITLPVELEKAIGDRDTLEAYLSRTPLSVKARQQIIELYCGDKDHLAGKTEQEKLIYLGSINYIDYIKDTVKVDPEVIDFFLMWRASYMGNSTELSPAIDAMRYGLPGVLGLGLEKVLQRPLTVDGVEHSYKEDLHFPDGNASVARALVRRMIPAVALGDSMHDLISAKFDYSQLDQPGEAVRLRLNATAVKVVHLGDPATAKKVEMTYVQEGVAKRVTADHCVMACYNAIIPYLCPELPDTQKQALHKTIRMPLVSTSVLIDNWQSFEKLGIFAAYCPGSYHSDVRLTYPLKYGDYQSARSPDQATTIHMYRIPLPGGDMPIGKQFTAGRYELLGTTFETFERNIRQQLADMLSEGGFDPARDIKGITVNRWPHGYAVGYDADSDEMYYWSDPWPDEKKAWLSGRVKFGRIAIANSDAGAMAMTESAIDQAHRATEDLLN